ncbi:hypothetical protein EV126DRAFT_171178 [Verticillium dahliae]|nr:hypothetical protein EV126DRAFT_171178 [Verticillium dahliae]
MEHYILRATIILCLRLFSLSLRLRGCAAQHSTITRATAQKRFPYRLSCLFCFVCLPRFWRLTRKNAYRHRTIRATHQTWGVCLCGRHDDAV